MEKIYAVLQAMQACQVRADTEKWDQEYYDLETGHIQADNLLCEALLALGAVLPDEPQSAVRAIIVLFHSLPKYYSPHSAPP